MNIKKLPNESVIEYQYRICDSKKELDVSWDDIAEIINNELGYNKGESAYRKWYKAYAQGRKDAIDKNVTSDSELEKLIQKKLELQKERNKLSAEKNEINKWLREQARTENIYDKIIESIENLQPLDIPSIKLTKTNQKKKAILDVADSHFGREGKIIGFDGETLAEYNIEIFKERMWKLLEYTVQICNKEDINSLVILNLGDSIDGMLRMSQLQFLQLGSVDQTMQYAEFISQWLNQFTNCNIQIDYYSVLGNHPETRPLNSQRGDFQHENMERIVTWFIKERLKNNLDITVHEPKSIVYFDVLGTKIAATHGQDEKNLEKSIQDYSTMYGKEIHILKTGHLHHHSNKTVGMNGSRNIEVIQSPAICGIDEYSVKLKKLSNAGTLLTIFEEYYGKSNTYDIRFN